MGPSNNAAESPKKAQYPLFLLQVHFQERRWKNSVPGKKTKRKQEKKKSGWTEIKISVEFYGAKKCEIRVREREMGAYFLPAIAQDD
ncbi:hypothetical protein CEXT_98521 [Caerostris extrusa]|uniref:Uncharacterized protein n=1 Tax=Caerostris extrusa TaxID=172846 RepID=A0AAV4XGG6_CAEEX|nr:hypothetical protein CEXT_98521 [Caerostris extrusa]